MSASQACVVDVDPADGAGGCPATLCRGSGIEVTLDASSNLDVLIPRQMGVAEHDDVGVGKHVGEPVGPAVGGTAGVHDRDALPGDLHEGTVR